MQNIDGKRCLATIIGLIVCSVVTILMKYDAKSYIQLFGLLFGGFAVAQTITDIVENKNGGQK